MLRKINAKGVIMLLISLIICGFTSCSDDDIDNTIYGTCEITGLVKDLDDTPMAGAQVAVMVVGKVAYPVKTTTNAEGEFEVKVIKSTPDLLLEVTAPGYSDYHCVISPPYQNPQPGHSLGTARIRMEDIVMVKK